MPLWQYLLLEPHQSQVVFKLCPSPCYPSAKHMHAYHPLRDLPSSEQGDLLAILLQDAGVQSLTQETWSLTTCAAGLAAGELHLQEARAGQAKIHRFKLCMGASADTSQCFMHDSVCYCISRNHLGSVRKVLARADQQTQVERPCLLHIINHIASARMPASCLSLLLLESCVVTCLDYVLYSDDAFLYL